MSLIHPAHTENTSPSAPYQPQGQQASPSEDEAVDHVGDRDAAGRGETSLGDGLAVNVFLRGPYFSAARLEVMRRIFYMAGVEKTTIYAIKQDLEHKGLEDALG